MRRRHGGLIERDLETQALCAGLSLIRPSGTFSHLPRGKREKGMGQPSRHIPFSRCASSAQWEKVAEGRMREAARTGIFCM
jgi:hypothetical protein